MPAEVESGVMIPFLLGVLVGVFIGFLAAGLCAVSKEGRTS